MRLIQLAAAAVIAASILPACALAQQADIASPAPAEVKRDAPQKLMTVDELLDRMEQERIKLETFTADVRKVVRTVALEMDDTYAGRLQFTMPRQVRLELTNNETKEIVTYVIGKEVAWVLRPQKHMARRIPMRDLKDRDEAANPLEYGLARDIHEMKKAYTMTVLPDEKVGGVTARVLEMMPIGGETFDAGKMTFWIDPATWLPVQVRENKSGGEMIETHTFSNPRTNASIKASVFEFKPDKNWDVIDEGENAAK